MEELPAAQRMKAEMVPALNSWADSGRFEPILEQVKNASELKHLGLPVIILQRTNQRL